MLESKELGIPEEKIHALLEYQRSPLFAEAKSGSANSRPFEKRRLRMSNNYLREKLIEAHRQDLLRETEQQRMLEHLPQHSSSLMRYMARKLAAFVIVLGTSLKRLGHLRMTKHVPTQSASSTEELHH